MPPNLLLPLSCTPAVGTAQCLERYPLIAGGGAKVSLCKGGENYILINSYSLVPMPISSA